MCGIAGWFRRDGRHVPKEILSSQCAALWHRGPDDEGILVDGDFGFGMRRLSILDPAGGHQPMTSADGRFAIVFNGEIYNHLEIRRKLEQIGHTRFDTHSDTETLLAAYSHWGNGAWQKLDGMFAVAVWDRVRRELTLARDPLGIKPLYLAAQNGGIAFASEIGALTPVPGLRFDIDDRAVHDFFSFGHVRRPRSIYAGISQLDPGHFLTIGRTDEPRTTCYWQPEPWRSRPMSEAAWVEATREMVLGSVRRHMLSDVPIGAFLSGGIDSSAVLAAMRRSSDQPIKAFTVGYPGAKIDETATARAIATHLGCEHFVLPLEVGDAVQAIEQVESAYDEPFAEMGALPLWLLSRLAAEHVKVVLCGEGSDEIFAGYKRHRNANMIAKYRPLIEAAAPVLDALGRTPTTRSAGLNQLRQHIQRLAEFARLPDGYQQFFAATQISSRRERRRIYAPDFYRRFEDGDAYSRLEREYGREIGLGGSPLQQFLFSDVGVAMPSSMLPRLDRASMAHSVEARVPFLSHGMVDFAMSMPVQMKLRRGIGKYVLRRAVAPWLPSGVASLPKQPLQIPLAAWFRGDLGSYARTIWHDSGATRAGYLDRAEVEALFREHRDGTANHGRLLYAILIFGLWWRRQRCMPRS